MSPPGLPCPCFAEIACLFRKTTPTAYCRVHPRSNASEGQNRPCLGVKDEGMEAACPRPRQAQSLLLASSTSSSPCCLDARGSRVTSTSDRQNNRNSNRSTSPTLPSRYNIETQDTQLSDFRMHNQARRRGSPVRLLSPSQCVSHASGSASITSWSYRSDCAFPALNSCIACQACSTKGVQSTKNTAKTRKSYLHTASCVVLSSPERSRNDER